MDKINELKKSTLIHYLVYKIQVAITCIGTSLKAFTHYTEHVSK